MGFFSQDCKRCGHPALSPAATTAGVNEWMSDVVAISPSGQVHIGEYDGYGRVGNAEEAIGYGATVYHVACWELDGKPLRYAGESRASNDQGWFFGDEHDVPDPRLAAAAPRPAGTWTWSWDATTADPNAATDLLVKTANPSLLNRAVQQLGVAAVVSGSYDGATCRVRVLGRSAEYVKAVITDQGCGEVVGEDVAARDRHASRPAVHDC